MLAIYLLGNLLRILKVHGPKSEGKMTTIVELSRLSWYEYFQENSDFQVRQIRLYRHEWEYFLSLYTSDL